MTDSPFNIINNKNDAFWPTNLIGPPSGLLYYLLVKERKGQTFRLVIKAFIVVALLSYQKNLPNGE